MPETALFTAFTEVKPEWIDFKRPHEHGLLSRGF